MFGASRKFRILAVIDDCCRENLFLVADTRISGPRVAREGCTRPQAGQLLDEQLIVHITDTTDATAGRTHEGVDSFEIERFLGALRAKAMPVDAAHGRVVPISKAAEKAKSSSVEIVHLILSGFLANIVRLRDVHGYAAVLVGPDQVRQQNEVVMQDLPASTAFGRLKIPKSTGWTLVPRSEGPRLPALRR